MRAQISYVTDRQKRDKDYPWLFILLLQTQPLYEHASYTAFEWKHSQSLLDQLLELIVRKLRSKHMQAGGLHAHGVDTSTDRRDFCAHGAALGTAQLRSYSLLFFPVLPPICTSFSSW